jgi:hypothetical protein
VTWILLALIIAGILVLAMLVLELALRMFSLEEQLLDEADVEDHSRPRGNVTRLDEHRRAG